jgi:hypothetical protein
LRLKSLNELSIQRGLSTGTIITEKGDAAITNGLQQVQRLQLQLDRSDGRPASITIGNIASKYSMLISSCLRTVIEDDEKKAWLAVLGPLDYVGYRVHELIKQDDNYIVDYSLMITKMKRILLDISSNEEDPLLNNKDAASAEEIKDLAILLSRIVLRYGLYFDQLHDGSKPLGIKILCDDQLLSVSIVGAILSLDFEIPYTINTSTAISCIDISLQDINIWKQRNIKQCPK